MATGGSLSWIWIAFEWDVETHRFFFLNGTYTWRMKPIYIYVLCWRIQRCWMFNGSILQHSWLTYKEETWAGLFSNKPGIGVSLHLRLVDSDVECSRTALNSFTRRARTMLAPMDSESLTVPLALEGSEERSSSQHRERERKNMCS